MTGTKVAGSGADFPWNNVQESETGQTLTFSDRVKCGTWRNFAAAGVDRDIYIY